jgi:hypothetical protein
MKKLELKYSDYDILFIQIGGVSYDKTRGILKANKRIGGLLNEEITQGTKTRLRRILNKLEKELKAWYDSKAEINKEYKDIKKGDEKYNEYLLKLKEIDISLQIEIEPISLELSKIEELTSDIDYDFAIQHLFVSDNQ